jgi:Fur family ferric uptake transcriptional regulator
MPRTSVAKNIIYKTIISASHPITSTEIQNECPQFDRATVYRILKNLKQNHLIRVVEVGDGQTRYESSNDHHHHLICTKCRITQRIDLSPSDEKRLKKLQDNFQNEFKFTSLDHSLEFFGLCAKCKKL